MTSKKRKYGDLSARPLPSNNADLLDDVFAAFTGRTAPVAPAVEETPEDATTQETASSSGEQPVDPPKVALDHPSPPKATLGGLRPPEVAGDTVAPARDFNKRANSLERDALPSGLFPGSSKKLYDALYLRTIGAVVPIKAVQATRRELGKWSGIKNVKTIAAHLRHLTTVGLIIHHWDRGSNDGSFYEVRLPEQLDGLRPPKTTLGDLRPPEDTLGRISVLPLGQISALGGLSQTTDIQEDKSDGKTSFKTNTERSDDDEPTAALSAVLKQAAKEITGREPSPAEAERWRELGELLATELKIAAGRTTVSNVPAFLTEHLRRRLWKKEKRQVEAEAAAEAPANAKKLDASRCLDCFGTGMWYPEGFEKGVVRCRHEKLSAEDDSRE